MNSDVKHVKTGWFMRLRRIARTLALTAGVLLVPIVGCQSKLIYFPRPYPAGEATRWQKSTGGKVVEFRTSQGRQRAFLQGNLKSPRNLWVVCGGNGTVALDWSAWLEKHAPKEDAWLLVDFPGYGDCEGAPNPSRIRETFQTCLPLALDVIHFKSADTGKLRFFGHSLGCGACLIAASEAGIQRGVLISPFTSTMDMSRVVTGLPLGMLVTHRFNNSARLAELSARGPGKVIILHGKDDEVIPIAMSRKLAAENPKTVRLREIPGGRHNTIQQDHADEVAAALEEIGKNR